MNPKACNSPQGEYHSTARALGIKDYKGSIFQTHINTILCEIQWGPGPTGPAGTNGPSQVIASFARTTGDGTNTTHPDQHNACKICGFCDKCSFARISRGCCDDIDTGHVRCGLMRQLVPTVDSRPCAVQEENTHRIVVWFECKLFRFLCPSTDTPTGGARRAHSRN